MPEEKKRKILASLKKQYPGKSSKERLSIAYAIMVKQGWRPNRGKK